MTRPLLLPDAGVLALATTARAGAEVEVSYDPPAEPVAECGHCPIVPRIQTQRGCPVHDRDDDWPDIPEADE